MNFKTDSDVIVAASAPAEPNGEWTRYRLYGAHTFALSVYSEHVFYEYNYPGYVNWGWQFRVDYFKPGGYVDTFIYNGGTFRTYTNAVYLNGAHFIDDLRGRMGDDNFFAFLKDYASLHSRGHVTPADFFAAVRDHTSSDISGLIAEYFSGSY